MNEQNKCKNCAWYSDKCDACFARMKRIDGDNAPCSIFELRNMAQRVCHIAAMQPQTNNPVSHPAHYTQGGIECIDAIKAALGKYFIGFLVGNVLKYLWRYPHKNGVEDLKKARWYLDRAIKEPEHDPQ